MQFMIWMVNITGGLGFFYYFRGGGDCSGYDHDHGGSSSDLKYYECGKPGLVARECQLRIGSGGFDNGNSYRRSPGEPISLPH